MSAKSIRRHLRIAREETNIKNLTTLMEMVLERLEALENKFLGADDAKPEAPPTSLPDEKIETLIEENKEELDKLANDADVAEAVSEAALEDAQNS